MTPGRPLHRAVIVGGGFAGLYAARGLGRAPGVAVTLIDRRNVHTFQPLLYQVATGALAPSEIAQPLRSILRADRNITVLLGEATGIDAAQRRLQLSDGGAIPYDTLIVATGARHAYFGHEEWAKDAPGLKTIDDALDIRRRILLAFEAAEREGDLERRRAWMTFVVVGGGPTGVELAGALGEIAHDTLRRDFRSIHPPDARIVLVEGEDHILPTYPGDRSASAAAQLRHLGVDVRTGSMVVGVDDSGVTIKAGDRDQRLPARTVLWAAGVRASTFSRNVSQALGVTTDRAGRVPVDERLQVKDHPEVLVLGDAAVMPGGKGKPAPGVAPAAIQAGQYAARLVRERAAGRGIERFRYRDRGDVAVIGRLSGVTDIRWLGPFGRQSGFVAWLLWLGIHLVYLIGFANRLIVIVRWGWSFLTHGRGARLILGTGLPKIEDPETPGLRRAG